MPQSLSTVHSCRSILLCALFFALLAVGLPKPLYAHPLGNFTTNRYSRLQIGTHQITLFYVIDMAEIPTHRARLEMDLDKDKAIDENERRAYGATLAALVEGGVELTIDGKRLSPLLQQQLLTFQPGQAGLETLRLELTFSATLPTVHGERILRYTDSTFDGRIGWQEVVVTAEDKVQLVTSDAPATDISNSLRTYPVDLLQSPPAMRHVEVTFAVQGEEEGLRNVAPAVLPPSAQLGNGNGKAADRFAELITLPQLSPWELFLALLAAFGWGAVHAMSPGHGKTIVGAYLVGSRGTVQHAILLGITTTITHTLGVFGVGIVALAASQFLLPEQLYPWLGTFSGLMVSAVGIDRLRDWWQNHNHHHSHTHFTHTHPTTAHHAHPHGVHSHDHGDEHTHSHLPQGTDEALVNWRSLLALGVSGGLMPCPSALVVMLGAIALGRITFGLVLITIFSLGLASVLTAIGIALVHAGKLFERIPEHVQVTRWLSAASALFIIGAGLVVALKSLATMGLFSL